MNADVWEKRAYACRVDRSWRSGASGAVDSRFRGNDDAHGSKGDTLAQFVQSEKVVF
jgi:hypothetical protein